MLACRKAETIKVVTMWIGAPGALLLVGSVRGLAIDGDHPLRRSGHCGDPSNEAALELLGVERCEDVAEVIVCRRTIAKSSEPAQKIKLLATEAGDIDEGLRSSRDREQAQQQHLVERMGHRPRLGRVRHVPEIFQNNNRLAIRLATSCAALRESTQRTAKD